MRSPSSEIFRLIIAEFERIGLRTDDLPGLVMDAGAEQEFSARLHALPVGATWRDVFPDMPAHWVPGRPESWTGPYQPLGAYDYQQLPTGPAAHVQWPNGTDRSRLDALVADARQAGWPLYGAGFLEVKNPARRTQDAFLVLERGTSEDVL